MNGSYNDVSIKDSVMALEARKSSCGLPERGGMFNGVDEIRLLWMGLDVDVEEMSDVASEVVMPMISGIQIAAMHGIPLPEALRGIYADAFINGVMYEKMRKGDL